MAVRMNTRGASLAIDVDHLEETRTGLGMFEPALRADLDRELRAALKEVTTEASARLSGHGTGMSARGYKVERRKSGFRVRNVERGAAIAEFAGSANPQGRTPRGRTLIGTLDATWGKPGRLAWAAWDARKEAVFARVAAAVKVAEDQLEAKLGRR